MKPIRPYVDYFDDSDVRNCSYNSYNSHCSYIRKTGERCDQLDYTYVYSDSNFTQRRAVLSDDLTSSSRVISTNCSNVSDNNYNPGIENCVLFLGASITAFMIVYIIYRFVTPWISFKN